MSETTSVTVRLDAEDKRKAEQLFNSLGLNMTTAFNMFIKQSLMCEGLPFSVSLHNSPDDFFYSRSNTAHLDRSIAQLNSGKVKAHELIEENDDE
ncbi:MAG: type II toxin-antitoxin system RelB/DinJ family antitoxin [Oscillospiraceae bacterium]